MIIETPKGFMIQKVIFFKKDKQDGLCQPNQKKEKETAKIWDGKEEIGADTSVFRKSWEWTLKKCILLNRKIQFLNVYDLWKLNQYCMI